MMSPSRAAAPVSGPQMKLAMTSGVDRNHCEEVA